MGVSLGGMVPALLPPTNAGSGCLRGAATRRLPSPQEACMRDFVTGAGMGLFLTLASFGVFCAIIWLALRSVTVPLTL